MASKAKSRWANDEEDAALDAQKKKERDEKKRLKSEKARKLEEEKRAREAAEAQPPPPQRGEAVDDEDGDDHDTTRPPAKRRRISPERGSPAPAASSANGSSRLLRFEGGSFGQCRSVENYDKLNDIEEGAYGWVARAQEQATGKVVALKRLKIDPKDRGGLPVTGLREIQILKDCDHRNVVKLREVVVGEDTSRIEKYSSTFLSPLLLEISDTMARLTQLSENLVSSSFSNSSSTTSRASWRTCPNPSSPPK